MGKSMARNIADMGIIPIYSTERQIIANALGSKWVKSCSFDIRYAKL